MKHTIDTKAIQELATMSPEVKVYLEREFPEAFTDLPIDKPCILTEDINYKDWFIFNGSPEFIAKPTRRDKDKTFLGFLMCGDLSHFNEFFGHNIRKASVAEIQRFFPKHKPE